MFDSKLDILLIEDNFAARRLLEHMLYDAYENMFSIYSAVSKADAQSLLESSSFDVIISDLNLPDAQGLEIIEFLTDHYPNIPVVILSGANDQTLIEKALSRGAQDFLIKGQGDGHLIARAIRYAIERKETDLGMTYLSQYDTLTGLANRGMFKERLKQALARSERNHDMVALLYIDLDRFKNVNECLGQDVGDKLLGQVADRLKKCVREVDAISRLSSDEFAIVVEDITRVADVSHIANKIRKTISDSFQLKSHDVYIGSSIGISMSPTDSKDTEQLISKAERAMFLAKEKGGDLFQFYTNDMNRSNMEMLEMESMLRTAVSNDEFTVLFQPKINMLNGEVIGAEALLRWNNPKLGMVSPVKFIPLAEKIGLIEPIGEWVIETVCKALSKSQEEGIDIVPVAVNLSARQFQQANIALTIFRNLIKFDLSPRFLEIEITESMLMHDLDKTIDMINTLKQKGIKVSIDDFGTGYSSLCYLQKFNIDTLKIDRSFVMDIGKQGEDNAIVDAIIALGKSLKLEVIAEGVETEEQINYLTQRHCYQAQGFFYSKPISIDDFNQLLIEQNQAKKKIA